MNVYIIVMKSSHHTTIKKYIYKKHAEIEIKERGNKEMEKRKDNWENGIIFSAKSLVYKFQKK